MNKIKIGLIGNTGSGKGTFVQICKDSLVNLNITTIKLADPLYEAQNQIYKLCNVEKEYYSQDGILLNFLGQHMRMINPNVLKDYIGNRLKEASEIDIVFCDDVRPLDVEFMKEYGFIIIKIVTDEHTTFERRMKRGDLTMADSKHKTEQGLEDVKYDYVLENNSSLKDYEHKVKLLIDKIYDTYR